MKVKFKFPHIHTLDDVLPHIKDRDEFNVNDKGEYISVTYAVAFQDTFEIDEENPLPGLIRRECRGLKFHPDYRIAARPFHKFFNIGERDETQPHVLNFNEPHVVSTKEDGSLVHPLLLDRELEWDTETGTVFLDKDLMWCTKAGVTDVSELASSFVEKNKNYAEFGAKCLLRGVTPSFEYVGPQNRIVLRYNEENMILLAARDNVTGEYLELE